MDTKEKVLDFLGFDKLGRKCQTDKNMGERIAVLVEKSNGDRSYAAAKWNETKKEYIIIYDPDCVCPILKIINGFAQ